MNSHQLLDCLKPDSPLREFEEIFDNLSGDHIFRLQQSEGGDFLTCFTPELEVYLYQDTPGKYVLGVEGELSNLSSDRVRELLDILGDS